MNDLKKLVLEIMQKGTANTEIHEDNARIIQKLYSGTEAEIQNNDILEAKLDLNRNQDENIVDTEEIIEESLSLADKEIELIKKALEKHNGKRKYAANELGISERTLYRKIKEYNIEK